MPVIKYNDPKDLIEEVSHFVRYAHQRTLTKINGKQVLWPICKSDILTVEVDNLPGLKMQRVLAEGMSFCIEYLDTDELADQRTHLPVKKIVFKPRHIEIILDRAKVGKDHF